jgi:predicted ATPase
MKLEIENFKSIRRASFNLNNGLNVLIGPNGSGKSCIFTSLKFIRDVLHHGAALAVAQGGGPNRVYRKGASKITFRISIPYGQRMVNRRKMQCEFVWQFSISQHGSDGIAIIEGEEMHISTVGDSPIKVFSFSLVEKNRKRSFSVNLAKTIIGRDLFSVLNSMNRAGNMEAMYGDFSKRVDELKKSVKDGSDKVLFPHIAFFDHGLRSLYMGLARLNEYNVLPDVARASSEQLRTVFMRPNGAGVAEVIHALESKAFHKIEAGGVPDAYEDYPFWGGNYPYMRFYMRPYGYGFSRREIKGIETALDRIGSELIAGVRSIEGVSTQIDQNTGKRFLVFKSGRNIFFPDEASDGTIKWLCILVSIFVPNSKTYLLEEPENFLHPWMQQRLVEIMRARAEENGSMFLITSHSTTVLNAVKPDEVLIVTQSDREGTCVTEIECRDEIEAALKETNFGLGDLWVSGAIKGVPTDA